MTKIEQLMNTGRPFLTDGGFETSMLFHEGLDLPAFAAIVLLEDEAAKSAMKRYFDRFLEMAAAAKTGFVLDTNTWRGGTHWASAIGRTPEQLIRLNRESVQFAREIAEKWETLVSPILVNGVIGPAGDGYAPDKALDAEKAQLLHTRQVLALSSAGVDMISALTMTHVGESVGLARAARACGVPVVISFTVETDGRLPTGETIGEAIVATDEATDAAPIYYMINCAHPDHFRDSLETGAAWIDRIGGVRANASRQSHAELDAAETLDDGDPVEFGQLHVELVDLLPNLRVVGGCCGTDHRHVGCVSHRLHLPHAA